MALRSRIGYWSFVALCLLGAPLVALETPPGGPYPVVPAKKGERCIVCGAPLGKDDVALIIRGRRVPLDRSMVDTFLADEEKYFAEKQPKAALFQEELTAPAGVAQGGISWAWFLFGLYVLLSLIFGALSGYRAVSRGLQPIPYFFVGFFFNAPGYLYVLTRPSLVAKGTVPAGFVKVPTTLAPQKCHMCGSDNHPAASKCSGCGAGLRPLSQSDVARVR